MTTPTAASMFSSAHFEEPLQASAPATGARLLVVDDEPNLRSVVCSALRRGGYQIREAADGAEALEILKAEGADLVVSDLLMPRVGGIQLLRQLKALDSSVGFVLLTGAGTVKDAIEALRLQADDYLLKPFDLEELRLSVGRALEHRRLVLENRAYQEELEERVSDQAEQIEKLFVDALLAMANAVEARDGYTGGHIERVTRYAVSVGRRMGLDDVPLRYLWVAGLLHDIGKLGIPDSVLNKPGRLTDEEFAIMKRHPLIGASILERSSFLSPAVSAVRHHHERWDGRGYPDGLRAEEIDLGGRILSVADTFDAITTTRPYRERRPPEEAVEELERCAGSQFDPEVVEVFLETHREGFLTDGEISLVSGLSREL